MENTKHKNILFYSVLVEKLKAIALLFKLRLATFVVFSSVIGLLIVSQLDTSFLDILVLSIAGFLVTGSSSALNQIFEKDIDSLMDRTKNRPVVTHFFQKQKLLFMLV